MAPKVSMRSPKHVVVKRGIGIVKKKSKNNKAQHVTKF